MQGVGGVAARRGGIRLVLLVWNPDETELVVASPSCSSGTNRIDLLNSGIRNLDVQEPNREDFKRQGSPRVGVHSRSGPGRICSSSPPKCLFLNTFKSKTQTSLVLISFCLQLTPTSTKAPITGGLTTAGRRRMKATLAPF